MKRRYSLLRLAFSGVLAASLVLGGAAPAVAGDGQHGPDPTEPALRADGPYKTDTVQVPSDATPDFAGGTIYFPTTTNEGTFGGVAIAPGYFEGQNAVSWLGKRLASHGFVVFTIDTASITDQPDQRGKELLAALKYLTAQSKVKDRVDASKLAVMGHSMGGGGALEAAKSDHSLKAAVPLAPWNTTKNWPDVSTPTFIIGADNDNIAPISDHADRFYAGLSAAKEKAYLVLKNANHFTTNSPNDETSEYSISWLKRFVDNDARYTQFLCPGPAPSNGVASYKSTCPIN